MKFLNQAEYVKEKNQNMPKSARILLRFVFTGDSVIIKKDIVLGSRPYFLYNI